MSLKLQIDKLEDAPEAARSLYVEKEGKFVLPVEGVVDKSKLDEFRSNNVALKSQLDELAKKFDGVDPAEFKRLSEEHSKVKNKKLVEEGKIEELLTDRTAAMTKEYNAQIKKQADELGTTRAQLEKLLIDNAIQMEAAKAGVRVTAMEDILLRGRQRFKLQDGMAVPVGQDGKVIYGKDGVSPQSMIEWLADLAPAAPHLFESSTGGGTKPGAGGKPGEKVVKRSAFEALDADARAAKMKEGFKLID